MTSWKKLLALLMALTIVFALAACDSNDDDKPGAGTDPDPKPEAIDIDGDWTYEIDYAVGVNEKMASEWGKDYSVDAEFPLTVIFTFDDDECTVTYQADMDDLDEFLEESIELSIDYLYKQYESSYGLSREEIDNALKNQNTSVAEMAESSMTAELDSLVDKLNGAKSELYFKVADGTIYFAEDADDLEDVKDADASIEFELDGTKLTFKEIDGTINEQIDHILEYYDLPWKFEKD